MNNLVDYRRQLCLHLLSPWPNQYVSGPGTYISQFWWKYLRRHCFTRFFGSLHTVTQTFDLFKPWPLTFPKVISISTNQLHLWPKFGEIPFIVFWDMVFTRFMGHCDLDILTLIRKASQHYEPKYICVKIARNSLIIGLWDVHNFRSLLAVTLTIQLYTTWMQWAYASGTVS